MRHLVYKICKIFLPVFPKLGYRLIFWSFGIKY